MPRMQGKRGLIIAIVVLVIVILIVVAIALAHKSSKTTVSTTSPSTGGTSTAEAATTKTNAADDASSTTSTAPADPDTLETVDVEPLDITVAYTKGTPGFEFTVQKTANKTEYVQFTSTDLIGTKCTNDEGDFASIIKNPSSDESQTTSQTVKVGNDTYGLSLASPGCTANPDLLTQYQEGFKNGFSSLKSL